MTVTVIAAVAENGVIGRGNTLPWHLPDDLKRFKRLTTGHAVVMGRKTFESIGRPLPNRRSIVVSRNPAWQPDGTTVARDLDSALSLAGATDQIFVIGGAEVFRAAMPKADRLELTVIHADIPGDAYFPAIDPNEWTLLEESHHPADAHHPHAFSFRSYQRTRVANFA